MSFTKPIMLARLLRGAGAHVDWEAHEGAMFARFTLPNGGIVEVQEVDGRLHVSVVNGKLLVQGVASNTVEVVPWPYTAMPIQEAMR